MADKPTISDEHFHEANGDLQMRKEVDRYGEADGSSVA